MTLEQQEYIIKRYKEGATAVQISKEVPYCNSTISRFLHEANVSRGRFSKRTMDIAKSVKYDFVENKMYCEDLAKKYNVDKGTIYRILDMYNLPRQHGYHTNCNIEYFEKIDTPNKAYLLGFITADGAVVNNRLSIEIHKKDEKLLNFAKSEINPKATITKINYNNKNNVRVAFSAQKLCKDLAKYGVIQNKSKIIKAVPKELIPKELLPYYFRGLIDGDGCVHKNGGISIYSGSRDFIESVQEILCEEAKIKKLKIYKGSAYFVSWRGKDDIKKLFNYLYSNLDATFYYERKYLRIKNNVCN